MEIATFTAWQTARLTTYGEKRLRSFGDLLKELKPRPKQQTAQEMLEALRAIRATMGG